MHFMGPSFLGSIQEHPGGAVTPPPQKKKSETKLRKKEGKQINLENLPK